MSLKRIAVVAFAVQGAESFRVGAPPAARTASSARTAFGPVMTASSTDAVARNTMAILAATVLAMSPVVPPAFATAPKPTAATAAKPSSNDAVSAFGKGLYASPEEKAKAQKAKADEPQEAKVPWLSHAYEYGCEYKACGWEGEGQD